MMANGVYVIAPSTWPPSTEVARSPVPLNGTYSVLMPKAASRRSCAAWLAEYWPEPARLILPGLALAAARNSWKLWIGLFWLTTRMSGVKWNQNTGVTSAVLYATSPWIGWNTMCGRLMPTTLSPSPGSWFICVHISAPPAPDLYCTIVSMFGHFRCSTSCWWRADESDSPPGGKACQYVTFFSGQWTACASASGAAAARASRERMRFMPCLLFVVDCGAGCPTLSAVLQPGNHCCRDLRGLRLATEIAGVQRGIGRDFLDRLHQARGRFLLAQVLQQHDAAPEGAHRIGQALAHDVEGGTVDRLEHAGVAALGIDVARRRDAKAAGERGGQVAQDVGMQVGCNQSIERGRAVHHARGAGVDQLLVPLHVGEVLAHCQCDFVPHHHAMTLRVGLGDDGELLARAGLRQLEREAHDALDAGAREDAHVGGHFDRMALVRAAADAGVFALGVLAHDHPVQVPGRAALERCVDARQDARGAHVGVLVEALADLQAQAPQRDVVRDVRVAGRAEQDRVHVADRVEPVVRHHLAVLAVPVAAPAEAGELETEGGAGRGKRLQHLLPRGDHFLAYAIAGDAGDLVCLHGMSFAARHSRRAAAQGTCGISSHREPPGKESPRARAPCSGRSRARPASSGARAAGATRRRCPAGCARGRPGRVSRTGWAGACRPWARRARPAGTRSPAAGRHA